MDTSRINELKNRASGVKNATVEGENTADRIGQLMYDIIDYDGQQSESINALERKTNNIQEQIDEIIEGGGGGGTAGKQKTFFLNISHGVVPVLPAVNEYSSSENAFVHGTQIWKETNTDPESGQDTYMMWSWFVGESPQSTSGPVKIYDGASSSSNGEDANETEWVYRVVSVRPTAEILAQWTQDLSNAKGSQGTGGINYTQADAVPPSWNDHPTGIDENNKYEYASYRVSTLDSNGKRVWGTTGFSEPILWASYGERGTDGDGVEYIFYASPNDNRDSSPLNNPPSWTNDDGFQNPGYIRSGSLWQDNPVDLSQTGFGQGSVQWVSKRKKQNGQWQAYSTPAVWSRLGKDGIVDGFTVDLSNENMPVGTDNEGYASYWSNTSIVQAFHNGSPLTYTDSSNPETGQFGYSIGAITRSDGKSITEYGVPTAAKDNEVVRVSISRVSSFNEVNAYIPITVYLPNGTTRSLTITVFGIAAGEAGKFIDLYVSTKVIRTTYDQSAVIPSTIKIGVIYGEQTYYSIRGGGSGSAESKGFSFSYAYNNGTTTEHSGDITVATGYSNLTVYMYLNGYFIDSEDIPFVKDGDPGQPGEPGDKGASITDVVTYYKATSTISAPSITTSDVTKPFDTQWSASYPYLYARDYYYFDNGDSGFSSNGAYLKEIWWKGEPGGTGPTGPEGPSGKDAVVYDILPNPAIVKFNVNSSTNTLTPDSVTVNCVAQKTQGTNVQTSIEGFDNYKLYVRICYANGSSNIYPYSNYGESGLTVYATATYYLMTSLDFFLAQDNNIDYAIKRVSVPVVRDGLKGESGESSTGQTGKFYYYGGEWGNNPILDVTDYQAPYVFEVGDDGYYMYVGKSHTIDTSVKPSDDDANWQLIKYDKFSMADAMFAKYAHIGAMIINRDWVISQYGSINGSPAGYLAYRTFDPVTFMTHLNQQASIGVITQSSGPNSQLFKIKSSCIVTVKGNGKTKIAKLNNRDFFRFDNSSTLSSDLYTLYSYKGVSEWTVSTTAIDITIDQAGTYCFIGGSLSDIKIRTATTPDALSVFVPNYAVDLRSGFVYQNNSYVNGTIKAKVLYQEWQYVTEGTIDPSLGAAVRIPYGANGHDGPTLYLPPASSYPFVTLTCICIAHAITRAMGYPSKIYASGDDYIVTDKEQDTVTYTTLVKGFRPIINRVFKLHSIAGEWVLDGDQTDFQFYQS